MKVLVAKVRIFLVISSVLMVWLLLAAPPAQAHKPDSPTCSGLPTAEDFFDGTNETADIVPGTLTPDLVTKQGTGESKEGNVRYRYAKITVPQLAAGELRVFDTNTTAGAASDAVLCHGTSPRASYRTSHPSSHLSAENARTAALTAQTRASDAAGTTGITESSAKSALRSAASALRSAASALRSAATALTRADLDTEAGAATTAADAAHIPASGGTPASGAAFAADTAAATPAGDGTGDETGALTTAAGALGDAAGALRTAANALHNADAASTLFQLRAEVMPGDLEYILVTTDDAPTLAVQFHGAIAATTSQRQRTLNAGDQHTYTITVTTPGLLTVETTGSTDTSGMLSGTVTAEDDSSGSGNNFKIVAPVDDGSYMVSVDGQTAATTGAYTLDMDFKVAMQTGVTVPHGRHDARRYRLDRHWHCRR